MTDPDFSSALHLARRGEEAGFSALFELLAPSVNRYLATRDAWDHESLTNEVLLQAFRNLDSFTGDADDMRGWVFTIARNRAIDDARRRASRPLVSDDDIPEVHAPDAAEIGDERLGRAWVDEQLSDLTEEQREVLVLRIVSDLSIAQIADMTGREIGAVKALQRRALTRLRKKLRDTPYPSAHDHALDRL